MKVDEQGQMIEIAKSVSESINSVIVSKEQRLAEHKELYARKKIVEIKNIKTYFPKHKSFFGKTTDWLKAVDDVTLDVYEGETLGLVGESGCGKTTLGRTILRLNEPTSGEIYFEQKNVLAYSPKEMRALRKDMQIIFQDPYSSLNPRISIGKSIMEPMQVHNMLSSTQERKDRVLELLKKVGLEEKHFNRYPHEFSGGQRQRVCIARALALNPKFIICDESVSALDVSVQAQVLNLLNDLKREFKFTYIFISHDLSVVKFMSDRMAVMNKGKIVELGEADSIYMNPQTDYTKKLINSIPKGQLDDIKASIEKKKSFEIQNTI
jgi:peptide/nickel transport system ATP-binding protein